MGLDTLVFLQMCVHKTAVFPRNWNPAAFLKNFFEKGIDFMEKWRYNAYLYEKLS